MESAGLAFVRSRLREVGSSGPSGIRGSGSRASRQYDRTPHTRNWDRLSFLLTFSPSKAPQRAVNLRRSGRLTVATLARHGKSDQLLFRCRKFISFLASCYRVRAVTLVD